MPPPLPPPHVCQSSTLATCSIRWMPLRMSSAVVARVCVSCRLSVGWSPSRICWSCLAASSSSMALVVWCWCGVSAPGLCGGCLVWACVGRGCWVGVVALRPVGALVLPARLPPAVCRLSLSLSLSFSLFFFLSSLSPSSSACFRAPPPSLSLCYSPVLVTTPCQHMSGGLLSSGSHPEVLCP